MKVECKNKRTKSQAKKIMKKEQQKEKNCKREIV